VKTNEDAAVVDRAYIKSSGAQGIYPMMLLQPQPAFHCDVLGDERGLP